MEMLLLRSYSTTTVIDEAASLPKSGIATRNEAFNRMIGRIEQVAVRSKAPTFGKDDDRRAVIAPGRLNPA